VCRRAAGFLTAGDRKPSENNRNPECDGGWSLSMFLSRHSRTDPLSEIRIEQTIVRLNAFAA
jgi:hypothetical protein